MLLISVIRSDASSGEGLRLIFPAGIDANQLAVHGAIVIVILAAEVITSLEVDGASSLQFWGALGLMLSLAVVTVLSGSRTGNLAALAGMSLVLFVRRRASGKLSISHGSLIVIPALALVGIMVAYPLMASKSGSLLERYREGFFKGDLSGRDMVWRAGVSYFSSSPKIMVLGGGLGGFDESVVDYLDKPLFEVAVRMGIANPYRPYPYFAAHNDFLRLACDLGIVGLSLFIAFYVQITRACLRIPAVRHESILPLALICTLFLGALGIDLVNFPLYPIVLALAVSPCAGGEQK
jgi:O-antigen ligase